MEENNSQFPTKSPRKSRTKTKLVMLTVTILLIVAIFLFVRVSGTNNLVAEPGTPIEASRSDDISVQAIDKDLLSAEENFELLRKDFVSLEHSLEDKPLAD